MGAKLRLAGTVSPAEAVYGSWNGRVRLGPRIEAIRARQRGEGQDLTPKDARALAGEWYQWFLARNQGRPGGAERWDITFEMLADEILEPELPDDMRGRSEYDLEALLKHDYVRESIRHLITAGLTPRSSLSARALC